MHCIHEIMIISYQINIITKLSSYTCSGGSRRVSVPGFYRNPLLKPEETLQDKFALKLYKPTNLYTAIEVNSYLETLEIFSTYVRHCGCAFLILDTSFPLREFIRIARVVIFIK